MARVALFLERVTKAAHKRDQHDPRLHFHQCLLEALGRHSPPLRRASRPPRAASYRVPQPQMQVAGAELPWRDVFFFFFFFFKKTRRTPAHVCQRCCGLPYRRRLISHLLTLSTPRSKMTISWVPLSARVRLHPVGRFDAVVAVARGQPVVSAVAYHHIVAIVAVHNVVGLSSAQPVPAAVAAQGVLSAVAAYQLRSLKEWMVLPPRVPDSCRCRRASATVLVAGKRERDGYTAASSNATAAAQIKRPAASTLHPPSSRRPERSTGTSSM